MKYHILDKRQGKIIASFEMEFDRDICLATLDAEYPDEEFEAHEGN